MIRSFLSNYSSHHVSMCLFFLYLFTLINQVELSLSFSFLPAPFGAKDPNPGELKTYSGRRVDNDSIRMVYFHDQTLAVVELGPEKLLLNCEVIEVFEPDQYSQVLGDFAPQARPVGITFQEMLTLMDQCKQLDDLNQNEEHLEKLKNVSQRSLDYKRGLLSNDPFTLLKGIVPGTKWCGTGDIAKDYFDLGTEALVDSCCRTHDLCPVKVRGRSKKYDLQNNSLYTKSHCECDERLFNCLRGHEKAAPIARIVGNIYFNLARIECVYDYKGGVRNFRASKRNFR